MRVGPYVRSRAVLAVQSPVGCNNGRCGNLMWNQGIVSGDVEQVKRSTLGKEEENNSNGREHFPVFLSRHRFLCSFPEVKVICCQGH